MAPNSIISSYRRPKNLKEILAPERRISPMPTTDAQATGCFKCEKTRCDLCKNFLVDSKTFFQRPNLQNSKLVRQKLSQESNLQCVGSITTELKIRFRNHKSTMKTNKKICEVALHFNRTPRILLDFTFQCTNQIQTNTSQDTEKLLITKKAYWSVQLFSLSRFGLTNVRNFTLKTEPIIRKFSGFLVPGCAFLGVQIYRITVKVVRPKRFFIY